MDTFSMVETDSSAGTSLLARLRAEGFVALVGSGVSMWEPCDLPPGMDVTDSLARLLSASARSPASVAKLVRSTAFEHAMEACQQKEQLGNNLQALYQAGTPNALHAALAGLLSSGVIEHIVTTNYDPCFEAAYALLTPTQRGHYHLVVAEPDIATLAPGRPVIFKIHGCANTDATQAGGQTRSMVFSLGREGVLPVWKRQLLFRLLAGRNLLICGYSGLDFEICPELPALHARIVWNAVRPDLKDNARRVLNATAGTVLLGDMREVIGALGGSGFINATRASLVGNLGPRLRSGLSDWDLDVWRVTLYSGIGCADEAVELGRRMRDDARSDPARLADACHGLGRGLFHGGLYVQAAEQYAQAAAQASASGSREKALGIRLDLAEAQRCGGRWRRARRTIDQVEAELLPGDEWLRAVVALRKVLIWRHWYELARVVWLVPMVNRLRAKCKDLLAVVADTAARHGAWLELQQCELWARRLAIPFSLIYTGPLIPLPSHEGYGQLGYFVAETMAIRDEVQAGRSTVSLRDLQERVEKGAELGARAETWKLAWVMIRRKGWRALASGAKSRALRMWWQCEYTCLMRLFLLLRP